MTKRRAPLRLTPLDYVVAGCATVATAALVVGWLVPMVQDQLHTWPPSADATLRRCRDAVKREALKIQWRPYWKHVEDKPRAASLLKDPINTREVVVSYRAQDNATGDLYQTWAICTMKPSGIKIMLFDDVRELMKS
jgi:hypothetical protein